MLKSRQSISNHQNPKNFSSGASSWLKLVLILGLATAGNAFCLLPLLAASPPAGTTIDNQATGTFVDGDDLTNIEQGVISNIVTLTVAEVAGVTVGAAASVDAPSNISGGGVYQSFPGIHSGDITYFDFTITNTGNDPTQFVIPSTATVTGGGTVGTLQIIGYDSLVFDGIGSNPSPINVPTTFNATTNKTSTLLGSTSGANGGSVPAGGSIKVRVPVTITASAGATVTVLLGNTSADPASTPIAPIPPDRLQNQAYTANSNTDVYTLDNSDPSSPLPAAGTNEVIGSPVNGTREASAIGYATVLGNDISGNVFEDINYGGGAGRSKTASGGVGIDGATVELYDSTGKFIGSTLTTSGGNYTFPGVPVGDFYIRTVNSTVKSTRSATNNGLLPVQTFLTDAGATAGMVDSVLNKVGGETPSQVDAGSSGTGAVLDPVTNKFTTAGGSVAIGAYIQSLTKVKVANTQVTGLDFGYNFDTIVNTNDAGQGSLRQFIINSNTLPNVGLDQVANPTPSLGTTAINPAPGVETSIFMIPVNALNANGVALINSSTAQAVNLPNTTARSNVTIAFPVISDAYTAIDGRTQTINIGNTNTAPNLGDTTTIVGVDGTALAGVVSPEVELAGDSSIVDNFLVVNGNYTTIRNLAISAKSTAGPVGVLGTIRVLQNGTNTQILANAIGVVSATNGAPGSGYYSAIFNEANNVTVDSNLLRGSGETVYNRESITGWKVTNNEISTSTLTGKSGNACLNFSNGANTDGPQNALVQRNFMHDCAWGIQADSNNAIGAQFLGNTIKDNAVSGILITFGEKKHLIKDNVITGNSSGGIVIERNVSGVNISQNSIFNNGGPGIDLSNREGNYNGSESISPNDGITNSTATTKLGNIGTDYPVITSSRISGGNLLVKGFIGNQPNGSSTFAGAKLEFFVADNSPANQSGEVLLGDGKNKSHGEGRTYIGTCDALTDSTFNCNFPVSVTDAVAITATATLNGNTSEFSSVPLNIPNVLLVKRITNVNGSTSTLNGQNLSSYYDEPTNPYDDNTLTVPAIIPPDTYQWPDPATFLVGGTDGGNVRPGDMVEYTIYFLSNGEGVANNVSICDLIPDKQTFVPSIAQWTGAAAVPSATGGNIGADRGIVAQINDQPLAYTNLTDSDKSRYYPPGTTLPNACRKSPLDPIYTNTNGAVVVDLGTIVNPINSTLTEKAAGFMRFRTRVN